MNHRDRRPPFSRPAAGIARAFACAWLVWAVAAAPAQDEQPVPEPPKPASTPDASPPSAPGQPKSAAEQREERAERLRRHREEMLNRMEEGKKIREQKKAEADKEKADKRLQEINAARENMAMQEVERAKAEGKPIPEQALQVLSGRQYAQRQASYDKVSGVFYSEPRSATMLEGERVAVDIVYYNKSDSAVTELAIALEYPPWGVKPVAVYADALQRASRDGVVEVHHDADRGLLTIHLDSPRPAILKTGPVATIVWEGIAPMRDTAIRYVFRDERGTRALLGSEDKLGVPDESDDGVVVGNLRVAPAAAARLEVHKTSDGGLVAGLYDDWSTGEVGLFLAADRRIVHVGEEFSVAVCLLNADRAQFDQLELELRFDPEALEAVDFDKSANIRQGVNMDDGSLAWRFVFDHYFENRADNAAGLVRYKAATANGGENDGEGVLAVARFRAKKDAAATSIVFVHPKDEKDLRGTRVVRLGEDILARDRLEESATVRVLPALPAPPDVPGAVPADEKEGGPTRFVSAAERRAAREKELAERRENRAAPLEDFTVTVGDLSFFSVDNAPQQAKKPGEVVAPAPGAAAESTSRQVR